MQKNIARGFAFMAILLALIVLLGFVFIPKDNTSHAGMRELVANRILGEPENSIDVLFLGDSEAYCAFIPMQLWEETGIPSYVYTTAGQLFFETPGYLKTATQFQNPKLIILETNVMYQGRLGAETIGKLARHRIPLLQYHDRWKKLRPNDLLLVPHYTSVAGDKGYRYDTDILPADTTWYMAPTDETAPLPTGNRLILEHIQSYCRKRGAQLLLVTSPNTMNWDFARHNTVAAEAEALGIPYMDMNLMTEEIPIDWSRDTLDEGDHLNYFGAKKVTDYMASYLTETGLFTDKRTDPAYSQWNHYAEKFRQKLADDGIA